MGRANFMVTNEYLANLMHLPPGYKIEGFEKILSTDSWIVYLSTPKFETLGGHESKTYQVTLPFGETQLRGLP